MARPHLAGLKTTIEPLDWSGHLEVRSTLDGTIVNDNVEGYEGLRKNHLEPLQVETSDTETAFLRVRTIQSRVEVAQVARTRLYREGRQLDPTSRAIHDATGRVGHHFELEVRQGEPVVAEKLVAIYSSRDRAISECGENARRHLDSTGRFDDVLDSHVRAWNQI